MEPHHRLVLKGLSRCRANVICLLSAALLFVSSCCEGNPAKFFAIGEYLYWQASVSGLELSFGRSSVTQGSMIGVTVSETSEFDIDPDFEWNSGFRGGVGMQFQDSNVSLGAFWTQLGLYGDWTIGCVFGIYGEAAFSVLYGNYIVNFNDSDIFSAPLSSESTAINHKHLHRFNKTLDMCLGGFWCTSICESGTSVSVLVMNFMNTMTFLISDPIAAI